MELLELDLAAGLLEIGLQLVGLLALEALLDGLRGRVDERLGLLEPEPGRRANGLDDLDLLVAGSGEHHVDRGRLLLGCLRTVRRHRGGSRNGRRRDAELLLERLDALGELEHGDALQLIDPLLGGHRLRCHYFSSSESESSESELSPSGSSGVSSLSVSSEVSSCSSGCSSAGGSSSAAGSSAPLTRPCSAIWPRPTASPDSIAARPRVSPVSGLAVTPTSWPCRTSSPGRRA